MKNNNNLNELLIKAATLIKAKQFDKAIPVYEAILEIDDVNIKALTHLPIMYIMKKRFQEAVDMINKSFKVVKPEIGDYQNLATAYAELKDYKNAINSYKEVIKINPKITKVYKLLGDIQMEVPDYLGAIDAYKHALELSPEKFEQLFDLGVALEYSGNHIDGLNLLTDAIKIEPNHVECNNRLASCLSTNGRYKEAKIIYKKLMVLIPDAVSPRIDYSSNLLYEGKYDEAEKILTEIVIKNPKKHQAKLNLSFLHLHKKNFSEGWKYFDNRVYVRNSIDKSTRFDKIKKYLDIDVDKKTLKTSDRILILLDGGLGDVILGLSMLKEFYKKYSNISAEVDFRLISLAKRSFPDIQFYPISIYNHEILIKHNFNQFDKAIYWLSLGKYVRQDIESFPQKPAGFLKADTNNIKKIPQWFLPFVEYLFDKKTLEFWESAVEFGKVSPHPIWEFAAEKVVQNRIILLGDASHMASPRTGAGAYTAMTDAVVLEAAFKQGINIKECLKLYNLNTVARGKGLYDRSRKSAVYFAPANREIISPMMKMQVSLGF